jgi:hypothetical protein
MTHAPRLTPCAWAAAALLLLAGCSGTSPAADEPPPARRSNVMPPSIDMAVRHIDSAAGASTVLTARPRGGEAILFSIDWQVVEGSAGGTVASMGRTAEGAYQATYTAPSVPGTYHVTATIHEYPAATVTVEVRVR